MIGRRHSNATSASSRTSRGTAYSLDHVDLRRVRRRFGLGCGGGAEEVMRTTSSHRVGRGNHHACHQQPAGRRNSSPRAPVTAPAVSEERRASVRAPLGARRSSSPTRRGGLWSSAPPPPRSSRSSSARLPAPARPPSLLLRRGVAVARQPARWPQPRRPTLLAAAR